MAYLSRSLPGKKHKVQTFTTRRVFVHSRGFPDAILLLPKIFTHPALYAVADMGLANLPAYRYAQT